MDKNRPLSLALLYPGDRAARDRSDPAESRFASLFDAFAAAGVATEPAVYHDDFADEVAAQLRSVDGVLVWSNPIESGHRRERLDAMLRTLAQGGVFVSTHPDTILRLGTKDVLVDTRDLPFGSDTVRIDSLDQLVAELPLRLVRGPRVLKQHRGHSGIGVWRVEQIQGSPWLNVRHAQRGSEEERIDLDTLRQRLASYFEPPHGGHMIDQAWQPRLVEGMVRAYLVEDRVAGFGHQAVNALYPGEPGQAAPPPGPRIYHPAHWPPFQRLKALLEAGWVELLRRRVGLQRDQLPILWDCDFLLGDHGADRAERYVLCEINVSSVSPFPPSAIQPLVTATRARLQSRRI
ncbi:Cj0069 family protein [Hydrogenophaga sp.]|uniref:Cj0069 family protein n=1 Tax=Hydrogenophaga sp. TaxID=1904254 RepID=UPI001AD3DAFF|nr:Cj0069 family protein [Hydrogenophaga sp.]MBN9369443.1 Cj0069 family protein [Hydrogenophaga sp.]